MGPTKSLHAYALACCKVNKEIWRQFDPMNYPNYDVSNMGRVRCWIKPNNGALSNTRGARWRRKNTKNFYGRYNEPTYGSRNKDNGYMFVMGKFMVHRLVGLAFIPNPENKPTIDHCDRIRFNNRLDNLMWATSQEQSTNRSTEGRKISNTKHSRKIWKVDPNSGKRLKLYASMKEACEDVGGKSQGKISDVANLRKSTHKNYPEFIPKTAYGYKWEWDDIDEYKDEEWKDVPMDIAIKDYNSGSATARRTVHTPMKQVDKLKYKYRLSNYGRLYDIKEKKIVHGEKKSRGNLSFGIVMENGEIWRILNNILTALIWLPINLEPTKKIHVNHKDGDPSNCHVSNLEWCTPGYNTDHSYQNGLRKVPGWTEEEDKIIIEVIKTYGDKNVPWKNDDILKRLNNRSIRSCSKRKRLLQDQLNQFLS
jgi:hypothetical protein